MAANQLTPVIPACEVCGQRLKPKPRRGPQSKYCSDRCRNTRHGETSPFLKHPRQCVRCGVAFLGRASQLYCSNDCRLLRGKPWSAPRICAQCGAEFIPKVQSQKCCCFDCGVEYSAANKRRHHCTCHLCGKDFIPKTASRTKFCSRECGFQGLDRSAFRARAAAQSTPDNGTWSHWWFKTCKLCGVEFVSPRRGQRCCAPKCVKELARRNVNEANRVRSPRPDKTCPECRITFAAPYGDKRHRFCSQGCAARNLRKSPATKIARRISKCSRRAMERELPFDAIDPFTVFDRDGWQCYLCGIETPRRLRGKSHDEAPELDHIIPLSRGGPHTLANVACCCRRCNGLKSDRI